MNVQVPNESTGNTGRFVGLTDSVGHALWCTILSDEQKIMFRSRIRIAENTEIKSKILLPLNEKSYLHASSKNKAKI